MIELIKGNGVYVIDGQIIVEDDGNASAESVNGILASKGMEKINASELNKDEAKKNTIANGIIEKHNTSGNSKNLKIRFDALASHDITYVGIIQTSRASGLKEFPVPYVLTNCHNSLCAVGGTINEDDHIFGLSAAKKYGGIFVPAHLAVIHQYMREMMAGCGKMILGSDSHTRYGALGTMAVGEGGPELVKQLLCKTYDIGAPEVVGVYLEGSPMAGVGPQDVALAIIGAVFSNGFVKNKVMEFIGPGIENLSVDYRNGIDVMTTETTCLTSIWCTDDKVKEYYAIHGRPEEYKCLKPGKVAYYDGMVKVDLSKVEPMIALPFHPSNVYSIRELNNNAGDILRIVEKEAEKQLENPNLKMNLVNKVVNGRLRMDQGVIAGCAGGTFENILEATRILDGKTTGTDEFGLSVYPASQPVYMDLIEKGSISKLMAAGAVVKTAFCGPCFGAGDVPANNAISARHTTRNFPNREGSKPSSGQLASVALMDARSIAATALNGGILTPANEISYEAGDNSFTFRSESYKSRVYQGFGNPQPEMDLKFGPNIVDWPKMSSMTENILLKVVSVINDPVTTTDELIPSGETSSYRSNPMKLAEFTLSRKDPKYVGLAKDVQKIEVQRQKCMEDGSWKEILSGMQEEQIKALFASAAPSEKEVEDLFSKTGIGSVIYAVKPGDGSAREQAASCQKVLGGWANIAVEYATKRYRSNVINWGMLPFVINPDEACFAVGDVVFIPGIKEALRSGSETVEATVAGTNGIRKITLKLAGLTKDERDIILAGSLINYYAVN